MKRSTKFWLGGIAAVVVLGGAGGAVAFKMRPTGTKVRTAVVSRRDLASVVTANGTLQARTKVELSSNIMGQITHLSVKEGDVVHKGDLLLVIDRAQYTSAVAARQSGLDALGAELEREREAAAQASRDLARAERQFREDILPAAEYDRIKSANEQARAAVQRAERAIEQARAELSAARNELDKTEIRAPMDGVVTRRNVEEGEVVVTGTMNNPGTVLMIISDMSTIEAVLEVDQTDVPLLRAGQPAQVLVDAFPDKPFPGVVSEIGSSPIQSASQLAGAASGTDYEVKVTLQQHPGEVRPGLTVTADITTATRGKAITVPIGALVLRDEDADGSGAPPAAAADGDPGDNPAEANGEPASVASRTREVEGVYILSGDKVEFRPVETGIQGELDVEIVSGLKEGESVITGPFKALRELKPGAKVIVDNSESKELEM